MNHSNGDRSLVYLQYYQPWQIFKDCKPFFIKKMEVKKIADTTPYKYIFFCFIHKNHSSIFYKIYTVNT